MKLLSAMSGGLVSDYKKFAEKEMPFVKGERGYYKLNLYPIAFKNTNMSLWRSEFSELTGFSEKRQYLAWNKENRFPTMRQYASKHQPKTIICLGKNYKEDFISAFSESSNEVTTEIIDDRELTWTTNVEGTVIFILPFMVNRYGLVKNLSIQKFGERMSEIAADHAT